jgi:Bacterial Ig-like domain (group 1)
VPQRTSKLKYSISVMEDNAPANGFSENTVLVRVSDPDDSPHAGLPIAFSADNGAVLLTRDAVTNHYGVARVAVVSSRVGRCTVTVFLDGDGVRRSAAVTFTQRRSGLTLALR